MMPKLGHSDTKPIQGGLKGRGERERESGIDRMLRAIINLLRDALAAILLALLRRGWAFYEDILNFVVIYNSIILLYTVRNQSSLES